jgi:transposase
LRRQQEQLVRALTERLSDHQRFMVAQLLAVIAALDQQIVDLSAEIAARLKPYDAELAVLDTIPGIGLWTAEILLAEIGPDMTRFPTAGHLASWAGMCPGNNQSGGKRRSGRTRKGNPWLRVALTEAAYAAGRGKDTTIAERYHRLIARRGKKTTAVAVGRLILEIAYHLLRTGEAYDDTRGRRRAPDPEREQRILVHRLEALGHQVTRTPAVA